MDGLVPCCRLCLPLYAALVHIPQVVAHFVDHAPHADALRRAAIAAHGQILVPLVAAGIGQHGIAILPGPLPQGQGLAAVAEEFDRRENRTGVNAPTFQFMRTGYFCMDNRDCTAEHLVFNRSVSLKDSFKK